MKETRMALTYMYEHYSGKKQTEAKNPTKAFLYNVLFWRIFHSPLGEITPRAGLYTNPPAEAEEER
jgi:hypothetical protein